MNGNTSVNTDILVRGAKATGTELPVRVTGSTIGLEEPEFKRTTNAGEFTFDYDLLRNNTIYTILPGITLPTGAPAFTDITDL